jgi:hypothetical protein
MTERKGCIGLGRSSETEGFSLDTKEDRIGIVTDRMTEGEDIWDERKREEGISPDGKMQGFRIII